MRLRIGREDVEAAGGIEVGDRVEDDRELGSGLEDNLSGGAPTQGDGTKMIEIVAISTEKRNHCEPLK